MASIAPRGSSLCRLALRGVRRPATRRISFLSSTRPPPPSGDTSSPIATSSSVTIEKFDLVNSSDPIIVSLNYASDTELIDALITDPTAPPPSTSTSITSRNPYSLNWTASIDPAFAFLALRLRPTFDRFIEHIHPRLGKIYESLRPSGMHQLLASDLLLRNGDPRVLRDLLELDAKAVNHLRRSAILSIYSRIRPKLGQQLATLSESANLLVAKVLMVEGDTELLPKVYDDLCRTAEWTPARAWTHFSIVLHMLRHGQVDAAVRMIQTLVLQEKISASALGRSDTTHPDAKALLVKTIMLRSCLEMQLFEHLPTIADEVLDSMSSDPPSEASTQLLFETCRVAIISRNEKQLRWAGGLLARYAALPNAPPLPTTLLDLYIDNAKPATAFKFYSSLSSEQHLPPSPRNVLRLGAVDCSNKTLEHLLVDVMRTNPTEFTAQRPAFLRLLIQGEEPQILTDLYKSWKDSLQLDFDLMFTIINYLVKKESHPRHMIMAKSVIEEYASTCSESTINSLGLARAYLRVQDRVKAREYLSRISPSDPQLQDYMTTLIATDRADAFYVAEMLNTIGVPEPPSLEVVINACKRGNWQVLSSWKPRQRDKSEVTRQVVKLLVGIRRGRLGSATKGMEILRQERYNLDVGVIKALIERAVSKERWDVAMETWLDVHSILKSNEFDMMRRTGRMVLKRMIMTLSDSNAEFAAAAEAVEGPVFSEFAERLRGMIKTEVKGYILEKEEKRVRDEVERLLGEVRKLARVRQIIVEEEERAFA